MMSTLQTQDPRVLEAVRAIRAGEAEATNLVQWLQGRGSKSGKELG